MELNELNFGSMDAGAQALRRVGVEGHWRAMQSPGDEEEAEVREALRLHSRAMMSSSSNTGTDFSAHIHSNLRRSQGQLSYWGSPPCIKMSGARRLDDGASKSPAAARSCIRVACRIRPTSASEAAAPSCISAHTAGASVTAHSISGDAVFAFDTVLTPEAAQADVYDQTARRVVDDFLDGFNGTVFVYGQTGSGKTHTIIGDVSSSDAGGIAPRAFAHVFDAIAASPPSSEFLLMASFVEIYQEKVRDLLNPHKTDLRIREGAASSGAVSTCAGRSGVWIKDAEEVHPAAVPPPPRFSQVSRCACLHPQSASRCCHTASPPGRLHPPNSTNAARARTPPLCSACRRKAPRGTAPASANCFSWIWPAVNALKKVGLKARVWTKLWRLTRACTLWVNRCGPRPFAFNCF